jgi:NADPH-dependent glutamate synthase beta subunit-like oxidoreductase
MCAALSLEKALENILDYEKLKYCFECGICTASCPVAELLPTKYNPRILLHRLPSADDKLLTSAELWLCAWCYRCYRRCPQDLKLPEIFQAVRRFAVERGYTQGFNKALEMIRKNIPLPASSCHVCFHPERVIDDKQSVTDAIQQNILDYEPEKKKEPPVPVHEKVAIIGSGPAGLSAAHDLAKKGYSVTVFEALSSAGGMLRRCIPEHRLPKKMVDFDIERIKELGVEIKTNAAIDETLTIEELFRQGYKAVFVATGAHEELLLGINGEELNGVFHALDFLENANKNKVELSDKVAVIGGGNVAVDAARTALRFGAKDVTIMYRRSKEEMPASPWEVKEAEEEGVKIEFLVAPKKILSEDGNVTAIECVKMELGEPDETGRRRPVPIQGSEFIKETGTVILAIGQVPNPVFLPEVVETTKKRTIVVEPFTQETGSSGIFAGGDAVSGPATLMEAIIAGKRAAISIDCYLRGISLEPLTVIEKVLGSTDGTF